MISAYFCLLLSAFLTFRVIFLLGDFEKEKENDVPAENLLPLPEPEISNRLVSSSLYILNFFILGRAPGFFI